MSPAFVTPNVWPIYGNWVMLPEGGSRLVALKDGRGLRVRSSHRGLRVHELTRDSENIRPGHRAIARRLERQNRRLFLLSGARKVPRAWVRAGDGRSDGAKLEVEVAGVIRVPVAFHVVRHRPRGSSRPVSHSSRWTGRAELESALRVAHQIYRWAGIALSIDSLSLVDVSSDLGVLDLRQADSPGWAPLLPHSRESRANVFVVGALRNNRDTHGVANGSVCVVAARSPSLKEFGRLMAHELGHVFGYRGHAAHAFEGKSRLVSTRDNIRRYVVPPTRYLMAANLPPEDGFDAGLSRNHVRIMRGGAKKFT